MRPIYPHLHYGGTTCPGARWREWVPGLPSLARQMREVNDVIYVQDSEGGRWLINAGVRNGIPPGGGRWDALDRTFGQPRTDWPDSLINEFPTVSQLPTDTDVHRIVRQQIDATGLAKK